ncbi:MAG: glycosyltransferase family 2 protein [Cyanobacteria bacterium J06649_11]
MPLTTPVAFIIFNRPDLTRQVFKAIRQAQPEKLLVIADGPRQQSDVELCRQARTITESVDWDCEVKRNYSKKNLGCRERVSSGLDWVFSQVKEAIILEDDCLPSHSFFPYCKELLEKYRDDTRIMHIGGNNCLCANLASSDSYYFSGLTQIWGWATWRRAWQFYDVKMIQWPSVKALYPSIFERFDLPGAIEARTRIWENTYRGDIDSWDHQWLFTVCSQNGLCILPKENLISNIGFGKDATHTISHDSSRENLPREEISFPLKHPELVLRDRDADRRYLQGSSSQGAHSDTQSPRLFINFKHHFYRCGRN